jgi:hypothetical protein
MPSPNHILEHPPNPYNRPCIGRHRTFNPGQRTKTIHVKITGDRSKERDETVYINLLGVVNAILGTRRGTGTILNDD